MDEVFDGKKGYAKSTISRYEEPKGRELEELRYRYLAWCMVDLLGDYDDFEIAGDRTIDGEETISLSMKKTGTPPRTVFVAKKSGLIVKEDSTVGAKNGAEVETTANFSDFHKVGGVQVAFRVEMENSQIGKLVIVINKATVLSAIPKGQFDPLKK